MVRCRHQWEKRLLSAKKLWSSAPTARLKLDLVLGAAVNIPLKYWRDYFFFSGAADLVLYGYSTERFPKTPKRYKTHPIFTLRRLPGGIGYRVCPCSSQKPYYQKKYRFISKGCRLNHTNHRMDRDSYIIDQIVFNLPPSEAMRLRFRGQVPSKCIVERGGNRPTQG